MHCAILKLNSSRALNEYFLQLLNSNKFIEIDMHAENISILCLSGLNLMEGNLNKEQWHKFPPKPYDAKVK